MINLIEREELFETQNHALKKANNFLPTLSRIDDKNFQKGINKVVDKVVKYFNIRR